MKRDIRKAKNVTKAQNTVTNDRDTSSRAHTPLRGMSRLSRVTQKRDVTGSERDSDIRLEGSRHHHEAAFERLNDGFDIGIVPWPDYGETTRQPVWNVRVVHRRWVHGLGSYHLKWSTRYARFTGGDELRRISPIVLRAAAAFVSRALGVA